MKAFRYSLLTAVAKAADWLEEDASCTDATYGCDFGKQLGCLGPLMEAGNATNI